MRHPMKELPLVEDYGENFRSRLVEWGGMIVSYETFPKGIDATPLFKGLPGDMCQSPHWGYIFKGRVRVKRPSGDEVLQADHRSCGSQHRRNAKSEGGVTGQRMPLISAPGGSRA